MCLALCSAGKHGLLHAVVLYSKAGIACHACRYKLPKELAEFKLVCAAVQKPLFLLALLHSLQGQSTVVFTASVEVTHRCTANSQAICTCVLMTEEFSCSEMGCQLVKAGSPQLSIMGPDSGVNFCLYQSMSSYG